MRLQQFGYRVKEIPCALPELAEGDPDIARGTTYDDRPYPLRNPVAIRLPYGAPAGYRPVMPDPADPYNVLAGLTKRLARLLPDYQEPLMLRLERFVTRWLHKNLKPLESVMGLEEWLASTTYSEARKQQLRMAFDKMRGSQTCPEKWAHSINGFIKRESYASTDAGLKYPRMINSRSDVFKVFSGPAFKSMEKVVFQNPWFIKKVPVQDRPSAIDRLRQPGHSYYQSDFASFEAHFRPRIMDAVELELYAYMLIKFPVLSNCICQTIRASDGNCPRHDRFQNKIRSNTGVQCKVQGRRMSGDMCTSLGNGFTNLMMWLFMCEELGVESTGYVEGDDGIFAVKGPVAPTSQMYLEAGWTIDIIKVDDPAEASFCGCLYSDGCIIRDPRKALCTFGWSLSMPSAGDALRKQLLRAKSLSMACELPQCPILGAIARRGVQLTEGVKPRYVRDGYTELLETAVPSTAPFCPPSGVRSLFERKFGISAETQIKLESLILGGEDDSLNAVNTLLEAPAACAIMASLYSYG